MKKLSMLVIHIFLLLMVGFSAQVGAYDEKDLGKLKALGSCPSCDLSEANLEGADLYKANLSGANLTNAIMKDAHIQGIIFCRTQTPWGEDNSGC